MKRPRETNTDRELDREKLAINAPSIVLLKNMKEEI